jgi:hypothetical protein
MGLLGALAGGGEEVRLGAIVTPCRRRTQGLVRRLRWRATGCGAQATDDRKDWPTTLLLRGDAVYLRESLLSSRNHPGQRQHDGEGAA